MTIEEAVERSTLCRTKLNLALKSGCLKGHKITYGGRHKWVIYRDDLESYIESLSLWRPKPKI